MVTTKSEAGPTDPLRNYRNKRDFGKTREPSGHGMQDRKQKEGLRYVIQRHQARRLHYDLRLELDGVLKSWAVPKGPSLDPDIKRLAMQVEDHPLEYGDFEGHIPAGEYGAGEVKIWDRGRWLAAQDPHAGLAKGHLPFRLEGGKLRGAWILVRGGKDPKQWLLRKIADEHALRGHDAEQVPCAVSAAALPALLSPQLAKLAEQPPDAPGWAYEIKFDGYRMLARCAVGAVRLLSRNGNDWTARLKLLAREIAALQLNGTWLDGEIAVVAKDGTTHFQALQQSMDRGGPEVRYFVFDVLFWQGEDVRPRPLVERWRLLDLLMQRVPPGSMVHRSEALSGAGKIALEEACRVGLEGLIGKRLDAPYTPGRSSSWIKLKCRLRQEFVIGGYSERAGTRAGFGALLLGLFAFEPSAGTEAVAQLEYVGRVGSGFDDKTLKSLHGQLKGMATGTCPFQNVPPADGRSALHWVRPELVAEVAFAGWTEEGLLRQASFEGLREDKPARAVMRDRVLTNAATSNVEAGREATTRPAQDDAKVSTTATANGTVAGIAITHPQRIVLHAPSTSKHDLARYYEHIGPRMMEHLQGRPVTLLRCPEGSGGQCFFQKHMTGKLATGLSRVRPIGDVAGAESEAEQWIKVDHPVGLVALVQLGMIELHPWGARLPRLDRPDRIILDLDPDPAIDWPQIIEGARLTRTLVNELGFTAYLKTTGGTGLHVVLPIRRTRSWEEVKGFSKALAGHLARVIPQRFTARVSKASRKNKIYVDYLRNAEGATAVAPYSVRARAGAPVSTPIGWDELDEHADLRGAWFNIRNVPRRVEIERSAPWAEFPKHAKSITQSMLRVLDPD